MIRETCFPALICFLASCHSIRYMEVETYNPSEVTYPGSVRKVLIVNNTLPQPPEAGYEFTLLGVAQDTCTMNVDSAQFDASRALGVAIAGTNFFDDVRLFHERTRKDNSFLQDVKLSREAVEAMCDEMGVEAVISFDRLLFGAKKKVTSYVEGYVEGVIDIEVTGVVRSYIPGRTNPLITLAVSDSLSFFEEAYNLDMLWGQLPAIDDALRIAGRHIGNKVYDAFTPHWETALRWYFTGIGAQWKEATAYVRGEKWDKAAERWLYIHNHSRSTGAKASSAANLALASEIGGDFEKALEWAKVSRDLFIESGGKEGQDAQRQEFYITTLEKRVLDDIKLNLQIREW
ncbi:MAG: DUF6340 family protein [Tannerellaceae bacterium]|jgi:hypothetical protein|nr:DUF6340 family protein [Tannerellaceae bacterium]